MEAPIVVNPIPPQLVNELAAYGPFNLKDYIRAADNSRLRFSAELTKGQGLPKGMICTEDGILTGIPAKGSQGHYEVRISAENEAGSVDAKLLLTIKPSMIASTSQYFDTLKAQVWEALDNNLPAPDFGELLERAVTPLEIYHLLERWAVLIVWDAFNLDPPGDKQLLILEGASERYDVYDRGSCLVAAPRDLFSHERTILDGLQTAQAVAREIYKRNWTIEMAGFDKLTHATWLELQHLGDEYGKRSEIINFAPPPKLVDLYTIQAIQLSPRSKKEGA